MAGETITLQVTGADGKVSDVVVPQSAVLEAIKDSHVPKDRIEADLARRVASVIKNGGYVKPDELMENAEFASKAAEKHGFTKGGTTGGDDAAAKQLKDAVARAVADVTAKTVTPLTEKLAIKEKREQALLLRDRERQILQAAADAGIKKGLLKTSKGKTAAIVAMLEDNFVLDEESGEFYVSDGKDGYVLSTSKDAEQTYMTINERVGEWAADPANADFVDPTGQRGASVGGGAKGKAVAGEIVLTHDEASQDGAYEAALKKVGGDHSKIRVRPQSGF